MNDIKKSRLRAAARQLIDGHDALVELLPGQKIKKTSEEDMILSDALDSLEEAISCLSELLDEEA